MRRITQDDIANEFGKHYGSRVLWETGKRSTFWYWDGKSWISGDDADKEISNLLIGMIRKKEATYLLNDWEIEGIKSLVKYYVEHVKPEGWDSDPWILNTPEGIVDLKTGKLLPVDKNRHCTKRTLVAPSTDVNCPLWMRFLQDITGDDPGMIDYLQRVAGYVLTGMTNEQCFFVLYGNGANGKSVFLNTVEAILNEYAVTALPKTFVATRFEQHPTDVALLAGARIVLSSETNLDDQWNEARIKQVTGGESMTARRMYEDPFGFTPLCKLFFASNHLPNVSSVGEALKRRMRIVPFIQTFSDDKRDKNLSEELKSEAPGILRWMIEGCLKWQEYGSLFDPPLVVETTEDYFSDQDTFGTFIREACAQHQTKSTTTQNLFYAWHTYAEQCGENPGTMKAFSALLKSRGFAKKHTNTGTVWDGLNINQEWVLSLPEKYSNSFPLETAA